MFQNIITTYNTNYTKMIKKRTIKYHCFCEGLHKCQICEMINIIEKVLENEKSA